MSEATQLLSLGTLPTYIYACLPIRNVISSYIGKEPLKVNQILLSKWGGGGVGHSKLHGRVSSPE